ncbi:MAG: hypothetical protein FJ215_06125 [Ignavibacteria bacterium]|nr:hypothetical protein [Ignavibacteria bacterium]
MTSHSLRPETSRFLEKLGAYAKKDLHHPTVLGMMIDHARREDRWPLIEEISFYAKFVTKAHDLMLRIGREGEGYDKISAEFETSTTTIQDRLKDFVTGMPDDLRVNFEKTFLDLDQKSFTEFLGLLNDFTWLKNWMVDGKEIP